ncbi:MAG: type III-A CRISPR-associated RAMP protein Csm4 [Deltaproteobacteria bacterium]|nr:type III-A CRISPR-associated RAMP protein Csm4 [Deltaproteobacteria bacterium]
MENTVVYRLRFSAPLHLGTSGEGYERVESILHSDTLFSALACVWPMIFDDPVEELFISPPFLVSSGFPFMGDQYFFPKPVGWDVAGTDDPALAKAFKRVRHLSREVFEKVINGSSRELGLSDENIIGGGEFWSTGAVPGKIWDTRETPRVSLDRTTSRSEVFRYGELLFSPDAGLFILVRFLRDEIRGRFEAVLRLLGDEGIGGDKRVGKGLFSPEPDIHFKLDIPDSAGHAILLSLYRPTREEWEGFCRDGSARYTLVNRPGLVHGLAGTRYFRPAVRMMAEGSVLPVLDGPPVGDNPQVLDQVAGNGQPPHPVFRHGRAFIIPFRQGGESNE